MESWGVMESENISKKRPCFGFQRLGYLSLSQNKTVVTILGLSAILDLMTQRHMLHLWAKQTCYQNLDHQCIVNEMSTPLDNSSAFVVE